MSSIQFLPDASSHATKNHRRQLYRLKALHCLLRLDFQPFDLDAFLENLHHHRQQEQQQQ